MQRIAGISKQTVHLLSFYENRFVSGNGKAVNPALSAGVFGPTLPVLEDGRGTMDVVMTLTPIESITFTFNATNLLGAATTNSRVFNAQGFRF